MDHSSVIACVRERFPKAVGNIVHVHVIGEHCVVEYYAFYKGELDRKRTYFMAWLVPVARNIGGAEMDLDSALINSIAFHQGSGETTAAFYAKRVLGMVKY